VIQQNEMRFWIQHNEISKTHLFRFLPQKKYFYLQANVIIHVSWISTTFKRFVLEADILKLNIFVLKLHLKFKINMSVYTVVSSHESVISNAICNIHMHSVWSSVIDRASNNLQRVSVTTNFNCIWGRCNYIAEFYVLLTVHLGSVLVNNQLDAQLFFSYIFIPFLYMFRTVFPSIIRSSKLRIQQRYTSNSCCYLLL
jgi:hypothetical protein